MFFFRCPRLTHTVTGSSFFRCPKLTQSVKGCSFFGVLYLPIQSKDVLFPVSWTYPYSQRMFFFRCPGLTHSVTGCSFSGVLDLPIQSQDVPFPVLPLAPASPLTPFMPLSPERINIGQVILMEQLSYYNRSYYEVKHLFWPLDGK